MRTDTEAKEQLIAVTGDLFAQGLLTATGGNLSVRSTDGATLWITPAGLYKGRLSPADLVRILPDGAVVEGNRAPSTEYRMHWAAYGARPECRAAVHTHAPIATAFGICNQTFPPINTDAVGLRDTVTVPWHMPGSAELATAVGVALTRSPGCIMQNHGLMTVGETLRAAATHAMLLEETAKIVLYCQQFGAPPTLLPAADIERLASVRRFL